MIIIQIIGNKTAGFILGLLVVINFALGSLVMNFYPEVYPPFFPFNLKFFFNPIQPVHFWLYLLIFILFLFGINLLACSIESTIKIFKTKAGRIKRIAALCSHIAILLALAAHLYEGFGMEEGQVMINSSGKFLKNIGFTSLAFLENEKYPDGSLKDTK